MIMKKILLLVLLIIILVGCNNPCNYKPKSGKGLCEMWCGAEVYYNKNTGSCDLRGTSGCSCPKSGPIGKAYTNSTKVFEMCSNREITSMQKLNETEMVCFRKYSQCMERDCLVDLNDSAITKCVNLCEK